MYERITEGVEPPNKVLNLNINIVEMTVGVITIFADKVGK